ncbi:MAG: enterobactin exporter EntS [Firmicutes bacterium ADurb.Bin182]|nr:MAG: enterobactin exporter EntS [Firmicutes bacterium ADurb.Bin182]
MKNKLWTKDFTIITLGSVVSMLGNAVSGFAIGLMVLDYTNSTLLFAVFMVVYSIPKVLLPLFIGPYLDRFSRRKMIYGLDFFSAGFYLTIALLLYSGLFNYPLFLLLSVIVGSVDSVYTVAYESFYPTLISEGNFSKAYSISSLMYPIANTIMVPVAGVLYETIGLEVLFLFNAVTFFIAACFETRITAAETHIRHEKNAGRFGFQKYLSDFKEGIEYLKQERGLLVITAYFFITMLAGASTSTLALPFFKNHATLTVMHFTFAMGANTLGRVVGGTIQYRFRYPAAKKFAIAMFVYTSICFLEGSLMYLPFALMVVFNFISGLLAVTSFNIRISATQNYVLDEKRGRFNGIFQMVTMGGNIAGQLMAGALGEVFPIPAIVAGFMAFNLIAVFAVMFRNREHVKPIYNREI